MACGVSPYRMLRPVVALGVVAAAATLWVMIEAIPDANQTYREITAPDRRRSRRGTGAGARLLRGFPNTVLYVREIPATGGWKDVLRRGHEERRRSRSSTSRARGRMVVDRKARTIEMVLEDGAQHTTKSADPTGLRDRALQAAGRLPRSGERVSAHGPARGEREMTIPELQELIAELKAEACRSTTR